MSSAGRHICIIAVAMCVGAAVAVADNVDSTPQQVFDSMRDSFQPAKTKGVHARYQWDLSGPNGGQWWIEVNDGTYKQATRIGSPFAMTNSAVRGLISRAG